jgi:hypothetical protein
MYGTVARFQFKPEAEADLVRHAGEESAKIPGIVFQHYYRTGPGEAFIVVGFESKEAYEANAASPEQHDRYLKYRALLTAEPEWHDGEIFFSHPT